ncbi:endonuclease/exonuclease/phosphatase family protein [Luteolibacter algae]|uniref:Endonuclease/exonuclease/phosphatase family protein n=1 Tax=Luteolibacter algae TaxID=454151 RepID=A0ABW5DAF0_9BACT
MFFSRLSSLIFSAYSLLFGPGLIAKDLTAMTWNIEWFPGGRPNASPPERAEQMRHAQEIIASESPDILLAQELTDKAAFSELAAAVPGMRMHVMSQFLEPNGRTPSPQQCGIASSLQLHSAWFEQFKPTEAIPHLQRGFAFAALIHPDGGLIMLYSIHLKSNRGGDTMEGALHIAQNRAEAARQLVAHQREMKKKFSTHQINGWIIAGDFNSNHDGQFPHCTAVSDLVAAGFHNSWENVARDKRLTWRNAPDDTRFQPTTFDYILTSGFRKTPARMIPDVPVSVSDHAPVVITLEK